MTGKRSWVYTPKKITIWRSLGYAINDMNGGAWGTLIGSYLMFFLTTYAKLSAAEVGVMFLVGKILDAFVCMIVGGISDNLFKTRLGRKFGRRHLLLLVGAIMIICFFPLLFMVVPGSFWWYFLAYFMIENANAIIGIAYETLPTEMTPDANERVKLSSVRLFVSAFATFSVSALPALLLSIFGEDTATAYTISGFIFAIVFAVSTLITWRTTWEFSPEYVAEFEEHNAEKGKEKSFLQKIGSAISEYQKVLKNKSARRMCTIYFMSYFAKDCYATAFLYFVVCILGLKQAVGQSVLSLSFIGIFVVPIAAYLLVKTHRPKILWGISYTLIIFVLGVYGILYLTGYQMTGKGIVVLILLGVLWQVGRQLLEYTAWQVIPFVPDVDTLISTKLRAGSFAAVQTFTRRATGALGSALVGFILQAGGYVQGQTVQSETAKNAIMFLLVVIPILCILYCAYLVKGFNLNQDTHKIVKSEIDRLIAGGDKKNVDPETKKVVEDLAGYKYEEMWNPKN